MHWNFQCIKCLEKLVKQYGGRKSGATMPGWLSCRIPSSKKGFEKNEYACSVERIFLVLDYISYLYLKVAGLTQTIQSLSKLWQYRKWQPEFPYTQLGLTGIATSGDRNKWIEIWRQQKFLATWLCKGYWKTFLLFKLVKSIWMFSRAKKFDQEQCKCWLFIQSSKFLYFRLVFCLAQLLNLISWIAVDRWLKNEIR